MQPYNTHKKPAAPVTIAEIAKFAKSNCSKCYGTGVMRRGPFGAKEKDITESNCICTAGRFLRAHPEIIITDKGQVFWPAPDAEQTSTPAEFPMDAAQDEKADLPAATIGAREKQLQRLTGERAKTAEELALLEKEIVDVTLPFKEEKDKLRMSFESLDETLASNTNLQSKLTKRVTDIEAEIQILQKERQFLLTAETQRLEHLKATMTQTRKALIDGIEAATSMSNRAQHKLRKRVLPLRNRLEQLDRRMARIRTYMGTNHADTVVTAPLA